MEEGLADEKVTEHMFIHEAGKVVDEVDLTVVYDMPEEPQAEPHDVQMSKVWRLSNLSSVAPVIPQISIEIILFLLLMLTNYCIIFCMEGRQHRC